MEARMRPKSLADRYFELKTRAEVARLEREAQAFVAAGFEPGELVILSPANGDPPSVAPLIGNSGR